MIKDMINVQRSTIQKLNNPNDISSARHGYPPERRSAGPKRPETCRSEASYATFASSTKSIVPIPKNHNQFQAKIDRMVPKLQMGMTVLKAKP